MSSSPQIGNVIETRSQSLYYSVSPARAMTVSVPKPVIPGFLGYASDP